ncbi:MAG: aminoacyl-tRNA hydrolase [Alphaproteobacteria bacterium]
MLLLVGIGNPGREHEKDRHNIGFMAVDEIVRRHGFTPPRSRFQGLAAEGIIAGEKILALKPMTYMNESGRAVAEAQRFYKLDLDRIIVIHDELDLVAGKVKVKRGGGAAGHNGIRNLDAHLGKEYLRVRLGIGHPGNRERVHGHVLGKFTKADAGWLDPLIDAVATSFPHLVSGDSSGFMNQVATTLRPPPDRPKQSSPDNSAPLPAKPEAKTNATGGGDGAKTSLGAAFSNAFSRLRKPQQK